jgi:hypothetical protein
MLIMFFSAPDAQIARIVDARRTSDDSSQRTFRFGSNKSSRALGNAFVTSILKGCALTFVALFMLTFPDHEQACSSISHRTRAAALEGRCSGIAIGSRNQLFLEHFTLPAKASSSQETCGGESSMFAEQQRLRRHCPKSSDRLTERPSARRSSAFNEGFRAPTSVPAM